MLPLCYSGNWMHANLAAYLGTSGNILVLDNYEADKPHFPTLWKQGMNPSKIMGAHFGDVPPCVDIDKFEAATKTKIDYITRWKYNPNANDSCTLAVNEKLNQNFERIFVTPSGSAELFQRRK